MARGMGPGSTCPAALSGPIRAGEAQLAGPAEPAVIPNRGPGAKRASLPRTLAPCAPPRSLLPLADGAVPARSRGNGLTPPKPVTGIIWV
jgi:hypothetical protein